MKHFIYKTTNTVNGRYYIGVHSTDNLDDGYLGSGKLIKQAIKKHGRDCFDREVISFHETRKEAMEAEYLIITEEMIDGNLSYNMVQGGDGIKPKSEMTSAELEYFEKKFWKRSPVRTPQNIELIRQWISDGASLQEICRRFKKLGYKTLSKATVKSICNDNGIAITNSRDPRILEFIKDKIVEGTPYKEICEALRSFGLKRSTAFITEIVRENDLDLKRPRFNYIRRPENIKVLKELYTVRGWGSRKIANYFRDEGISVSEVTVLQISKELGLSKAKKKTK